MKKVLYLGIVTFLMVTLSIGGNSFDQTKSVYSERLNSDFDPLVDLSLDIIIQFCR